MLQRMKLPCGWHAAIVAASVSRCRKRRAATRYSPAHARVERLWRRSNHDERSRVGPARGGHLSRDGEPSLGPTEADGGHLRGKLGRGAKGLHSRSIREGEWCASGAGDERLDRHLQQTEAAEG